MSTINKINEKIEKIKKSIVKNINIYLKLTSNKGMILEKYERINKMFDKIK